MDLETGGYFIFLLVIIGALLFFSLHRGRRKTPSPGEAEFAAGVRAFGAHPVDALSGLADAAEDLSPGRFAALARETRLLELIGSHVPDLMTEDGGKAALEGFFARHGEELVALDAGATVGIVEKIFYFKPGHEETQGFGLALLKSLPEMSSGLSERVYHSTLSLLDQNGDSEACKSLVLEVGRWHLARAREDHGTAIFDERTIRNDILARSI